MNFWKLPALVMVFVMVFVIVNDNNNNNGNNNFVAALDNGLARTPPMGWLSWERFVCETDCNKWPGECIDENLFMDMANRMVADGYKDAGYHYVNIDDCWSKRERDPTTKRLVPERQRFSIGLNGLADYMHARGLSLGTYGDCGTYTCQRFPGQLKYENLTDNYFSIDAQALAEWQVDSFKFDGCYLDPHKASAICPHMGEALNQTGRPILFVCSWPFYEMYAHLEPNFDLVRRSCNVWRNFDDIEDSWQSVLATIDFYIKHQDTIVKYHGPGGWFDPDQLVIGNFGLSGDQERAQMAIWAIWAAPLYMSNDLRRIRSESRDILLNRHVIGVNQDKLGHFGLMVWQNRDKSMQAFVKSVLPERSGDKLLSFAVVYLNRNTLGNRRTMSVPLDDLLRRQSKEQQDKAKLATFNVYDLFDDNKLINANFSGKDSLELIVNPSGVRMVKLVPQAQ